MVFASFVWAHTHTHYLYVIAFLFIAMCNAVYFRIAYIILCAHRIDEPQHGYQSRKCVCVCVRMQYLWYVDLIIRSHRTNIHAHRL